MVEWVRLGLDIGRFDDAVFEPYLQRALSAGFRFAIFDELGDLPALYALNKAIPERGDFYAYEEYVAQRIDVPAFDPRGRVGGDGCDLTAR
jgi:hypothetical protein